MLLRYKSELLSGITERLESKKFHFLHLQLPPDQTIILSVNKICTLPFIKLNITEAISAVWHFGANLFQVDIKIQWFLPKVHLWPETGYRVLTYPDTLTLARITNLRIFTIPVFG
jgi:hypothetical protein